MQDLTNWKPRPAPQPLVSTGRHVMIEPYRRSAHKDALWDALGGPQINDLIRFFPNGPYENADQLADWLDANSRAGMIVNIFRSRRNGDVVGMASLMRADPANGVVEVGSVAHGAAMARSPLATEAHYLLARHVFEDLGYRRYEWKCHNQNEASKRAAIRLGFTFEGLFRQHIVSKGANRDTAWYSMIDGEWPMLARAFETWLDPANFEAGRQRRSLEAVRQALQTAGDGAETAEV